MMGWLRRRYRLEAAQDAGHALRLEAQNLETNAREARRAGFHLGAAALEADAQATRDCLATVELTLAGRQLTIWLGQP